MTRPSFQFYPADWQANSNLRRCTRVEKSVWLDVLCLMHDSQEYGLLRWSLKEIAVAANCKISELNALVDKGVLKGADAGKTCAPYIYTPRSGRKNGTPVTLIEAQPGPIWFSSRMVRDEHVRKNAGASTRFGGSRDEEDEECPNQLKNRDNSRTLPSTKRAPSHSPRHRHGEDQSDGSSSSSSSSPSESYIFLPPGGSDQQSLDDWPPEAESTPHETSSDLQTEFEQWWKAYPGRVGADGKAKKAGKAAALNEFRKARKQASLKTLLDGAREYAKTEDHRYVVDPERWLKRGKWADEVTDAPRRDEPSGTNWQL